MRRLLPLTTAMAAVVAVTAVLASAGDTRRARRPSETVGSQTVARSAPAVAASSTARPPKPSIALKSITPDRHGGRTPVHQHQSSGGLGRKLGQMMVARFAGQHPSRLFLSRVESGQIGGVILFADNLAGGLSTAHALVEKLQHAAKQGGNPPLLIMTDQEGGTVRRLPGPPYLAPAAMTSDSTAFDEGQATGRLLRLVGVNVDLAPVADVERVHGSFLGSRSFGDSPILVADRACAFARGLASQRVAYTLKHFPGLGRGHEQHR